MTGPDDPDDERNDRDERTNDHWLSTLLSALASLESGDGERRTTGRRRGDRSTIDYDISIRSVDELTDDDQRPGRTPFPRDNPGDRSDDPDRRTRRYRPSAPSSEHRVTSREYEDELLVSADVGGVDPEEVTVGFDGSTLVIGVSGRELDRIEVPWPEAERRSRAAIKNGVLTVQIEPVSESEGTHE